MKQPVGLKTPGKFIFLRIFDFQTQHLAAQKTFKSGCGDIIDFYIRFRINLYRVVRDDQIWFLTNMKEPKRQI